MEQPTDFYRLTDIILLNCIDNHTSRLLFSYSFMPVIHCSFVDTFCWLPPFMTTSVPGTGLNLTVVPEVAPPNAAAGCALNNPVPTGVAAGTAPNALVCVVPPNSDVCCGVAPNPAQ